MNDCIYTAIESLNLILFQDPYSEERFHVELHFSPGAYTCGENKKKDPNSLGYRSQMSEKKKKNEDKEIKEKAANEEKEKKISKESSQEESGINHQIPKVEVLKDTAVEGFKHRDRLPSAPSDLELHRQVVKANAAKKLLKDLSTEDNSSSVETESKTDNADASSGDVDPPSQSSLGFVVHDKNVGVSETENSDKSSDTSVNINSFVQDECGEMKSTSSEKVVNFKQEPSSDADLSAKSVSFVSSGTSFQTACDTIDFTMTDIMEVSTESEKVFGEEVQVNIIMCDLVFTKDLHFISISFLGINVTLFMTYPISFNLIFKSFFVIMNLYY